MKIQMILAALAVFAVSSAFASDSGQQQTLAWKTKRIRCHSMSAFDPYIDVRGSLQYSEQGEARAQLRLDFNSAYPGSNIRLVGQYVKQRGMEFADLQSSDAMDHVYVYIDFTDQGFTGRSTVDVDGNFFKMACNY